MRLGLGPVDLGTVEPRTLFELAEAAAASSFDCIWVSEARQDGGGALAVAAMLGQRVPIRVGAVVDAGRYHPLHLAEDIAVADVATAGRLEVILRPAHDDPDVLKEHLHLLAAAIAGAHIQWEGLHLRVPARLADNGAVPQHLAINPQPAQPAVPAWVLDGPPEWTGAAEQLGFGVVRTWRAGLALGSSRLRLPRLVVCPNLVEPDELLAAAGEQPAYFVVAAASAEEARVAGRRLVGPLRMPEFPAWVNARR